MVAVDLKRGLAEELASVLQAASSEFATLLVLRSQRDEKCEETENGQFTVPDVASIEEKPSARSRKSYQNTSIVLR